MSKKNVAYIKPQEPAFLARLKKEVGYKEGPTVDTKREALPQFSSDESEGEDQQPVVVVLNPGDLTAEEVAQAKKAESETRADLSKKVVFQKPPSSKRGGGEVEVHKDKKMHKPGEKKNKDKQKDRQTKGPLSFADEEEEEI